jgi:hypothetical protein
VSVLFCIVIISGVGLPFLSGNVVSSHSVSLQAIRAIRHPERYGPRSAGRHGTGEAPQSRARGLTRAILSTFPIVKFGGSPQGDSSGPRKDVEDAVANVRMNDMTPPAANEAPTAERRTSSSSARSVPVVPASVPDVSPVASGSTVSPPTASPQPRIKTQDQNSGSSDVFPAAIGKETCPICIVDFEDGDDLRQLPCEGHHRFHQECVDPWLLELSSSCPICRHGMSFHLPS